MHLKSTAWSRHFLQTVMVVRLAQELSLKADVEMEAPMEIITVF